MDVQTVGSVAMVAFCGGIVLLFLISFLSYRRGGGCNPNHLPSVPEVRGSMPLLGHLLQLKEKKPHKTFTKWAETYGPIYSIKTGATTVVVINSSHLAKEAMVTRFGSISTRKLTNAFKILTSDKSIVAMSDYGDYHKTVKHHILASVLGPDAQKKHRVHRDSMMENLSYKLHALAPNSHCESVNLRKIFQSELFSLALKQAVGKDVENLYVKEIGTTMTREEIFQVLVRDPFLAAIEVDWRDFFPYLKWIPNTNFEKKIQRVQFRREVVMKALIEEHRARIESGENLNSFIDYLQLEGQTLTEKQLRASLWESIVEASDTIMVTTEWAMYELAKNTKKQARLYDEILNVCGSQKITEEKLSKLPYLSAIFHETLRRHSPLPILPLRYVHENTDLGGYHVPAGTELAINIHGCNMEKEVWENPEEWNPERFLVKGENINLFETMSFGGGKRVCAGAMLALLISCTSIGRMVQEFEWSLKDDTGDDDSTLGLTTHKCNPILAVIKPRN